MNKSDAFRGGIIPGALAGVIGGLAFGAAMIELGILGSIASLVRAESPVLGFFIHMAVAAVIGAGFGLLVWYQRPEVGETVFWGLTYGAVWWFIGAVTLLPLLSGEPIAWDVGSARELLPALLGHLVYGGVAAFALVALQGAQYKAAGAFDVGRSAAVRGVIAGLGGGFLLGLALDDQLGVPAVSAAMTDKSRLAAWLVVLGIGALAGLGYALLYPRATDGAGPALVRGMAYGFLWWVAVALTLLPLIDGDGLRWSVDDVRAGFGTLPGYLLFLGALLALFYQWLTVIERVLLSDDVAYRAYEGVGTQGLRAIGRGAVAGLAGGLIFTIIMVQIGFLTTVASLIDRESAFTGFVVHLIVANLIGLAYGLLFVRCSNDVGSALGWGVAYGVLWWLMGPLTLLPILVGETPQWTVEAATAAYPALVGHLAYGAVLGVTFFWLESRHNPWWITRNEAEAERARRATDQLLSSAPALWVLTVLIVLTIPLLLTS